MKQATNIGFKKICDFVNILSLKINFGSDERY